MLCEVCLEDLINISAVAIRIQPFTYPMIVLGAVHKCQHFHECTNDTLSREGGSVKIKTF